MLNVVKISQKKITLDFSESFGPKFSSVEVTRIYVNDALLFTNAAEFLTEPYDGSLLLDICEQCGSHGCAEQSWVTIRKSNDMIVFLPPFSEAADNPDIMDTMDYWIGGFLRRGLCFSEDKYEMLRQIIPTLPAPRKMPPLSNYEALCLFQAEAPYNIIGKFPCNPILEKKLYLCSEDDNLPGLLDRNIKMLTDVPTSTALLKRIEQEPLSIYLDTVDLKQWPLMYKVKNSYHLRLKPNFYIASS